MVDNRILPVCYFFVTESHRLIYTDEDGGGGGDGDDDDDDDDDYM